MSGFKNLIIKNASKTKNFFKYFKRKKVLFVWIPKSAGTSLSMSLKKSCNMREFLSVEYAKEFFNNQGSVTFGHISAKKLNDIGVINDKFFNESFKFCVCRNPFDRFISLFHYLKKRELIPESFTPLDLILKIKDGLPAVGLYNVKGLSQCNPQVDWIKEIELNMVLRFEDLQNEKLKLESILKTKIDLPQLNNSLLRKNAHEELDNKSIELIKIFYKEDFEFFGYSFDPKPI